MVAERIINNLLNKNKEKEDVHTNNKKDSMALVKGKRMASHKRNCSCSHIWNQ
jgi:hypothetical protein